jgi:hypothetical protein
MKTKTPERNRFEELYQVSLDYQKADGYWVCSHKEDVLVSVEHGMTLERASRKPRPSGRGWARRREFTEPQRCIAATVVLR